MTRRTPEELEREAALVAAAQAGDRAAYETLVEGLRPLLASLAHRTVRAPEDADDIIQQALMRGWRQLPGFRGQVSFKAWIARVTICTALNHVRDQPAFEPLEVDDVPSFTHALNTARLVAGQLWDRVQGFLVTMPDKQRLVMELRLFHEMDFEEIAALAECTAGSARVQFHQGLKLIRKATGDLAPGR